MSSSVKIIGGDQVANSAGSVKDLAAVGVAARLFSVVGYNSTGGTVNLLIFDSAAAVADGATPLMCVPVSSKQTGGFDWTDGRPMTAGIYVCWSSTDLTKTLAAVNSGLIDVQYRKTG